MNADPRNAQPNFNLIEPLPDGSFVFYPHGKQAFRGKSGRFYIDYFRSKNIVDLEKAARFYKNIIRWWGSLSALITLSIMMFYPLMMRSLSTNVGLVAISLSLAFFAFAFAMSSIILPKVLTAFFPTVQYLAREIDSNVVQDVLREYKKRRISRAEKISASILFALFSAGIIYCAWKMIAHRRDPTFWDMNIPNSLFVVGVTSFVGTISLLRRVPSAAYSWGFSKIFFLAYLGFSVAWIGILSCLGYPISYIADPKAHNANPVTYKNTAWVGVDWRTEISQADEPKTWPFKEPSYMLGCQGINGNYSVYLVKTEDISFKSDRAETFVPQYYGLKGSLPGWEKGESQLLNGQSVKVFQKYVEFSLELCKKAEAKKDIKKQVPVDKKQQRNGLRELQK